jgi:hypothetical protein
LLKEQEEMRAAIHDAPMKVDRGAMRQSSFADEHNKVVNHCRCLVLHNLFSRRISHRCGLQNHGRETCPRGWGQFTPIEKRKQSAQRVAPRELAQALCQRGGRQHPIEGTAGGEDALPRNLESASGILEERSPAPRAMNLTLAVAGEKGAASTQDGHHGGPRRVGSAQGLSGIRFDEPPGGSTDFADPGFELPAGFLTPKPRQTRRRDADRTHLNLRKFSQLAGERREPWGKILDPGKVRRNPPFFEVGKQFALLGEERGPQMGPAPINR